jgi:D-alanyl-lipoteichoic acid acyltransferase DltB (MBOAT superfamily)
MLFNSLDFAIFLPIVFALYWLVNVRSLKVQNFLILASSYFFYGWWDVKFLGLILFSTLVDYFIGLKIANETDKSHRKLFLFFSLAINLGLLGYFKYSNFFIESFVDAFNLMGAKIQTSTLQIILPVGISFYTFQTLSYSIDIYRNQLKPTRDLLAFAAFVSFFPQLVAGPIERASNLLPQFFQKRKFNYNLAVNGCKQIL